VTSAARLSLERRGAAAAADYAIGHPACRLSRFLVSKQHFLGLSSTPSLAARP
jgi:hypothetical protein